MANSSVVDEDDSQATRDLSAILASGFQQDSMQDMLNNKDPQFRVYLHQALSYYKDNEDDFSSQPTAAQPQINKPANKAAATAPNPAYRELDLGQDWGSSNLSFATSSYPEDEAELSKASAINKAIKNIVEDRGWALEGEIEKAAHPEANLGTLSKKLTSKGTHLPLPRDFRELMEDSAEKKPRIIIPKGLKYSYRIHDNHWAELAPQRKVDDLLLQSTKSAQGFRRMKLQDKSLDYHLCTLEDVNSHLAHTLRVLGTACHANSHVYLQLMEIKKSLTSSSSPVDPTVASALDKALMSCQLAQEASTDAGQIVIKQRDNLVRKQRQIWVEASNLRSEVKSQATDLPLPMGRLDDQGNVLQPLLGGEPLKKLVESRYQSAQWLDKVTVSPFKKFKQSYENKKVDFKKPATPAHQTSSGKSSKSSYKPRDFPYKKPNKKPQASKEKGKKHF